MESSNHDMLLSSAKNAPTETTSEFLRFITPSHEIVDIEVSSWSDSLRGQKYFDQLIVTDLKYKVCDQHITLISYCTARLLVYYPIL